MFLRLIKSTLQSESSQLDAADYALVNWRLQRLSRVQKLIPLMDAF